MDLVVWWNMCCYENISNIVAACSLLLCDKCGVFVMLCRSSLTKKCILLGYAIYQKICVDNYMNNFNTVNDICSNWEICNLNKILSLNLLANSTESEFGKHCLQLKEGMKKPHASQFSLHAIQSPLVLFLIFYFWLSFFLCFLCRCRYEFDLIINHWKCFSEFVSFIGYSHVSCSLVAFLVLNSINVSFELLDTKQALELWMILFNASDLWGMKSFHYSSISVFYYIFLVIGFCYGFVL